MIDLHGHGRKIQLFLNTAKDKRVSFEFIISIIIIIILIFLSISLG